MIVVHALTAVAAVGRAARVQPMCAAALGSLLSVQVASCACSALWHGNDPLPTTLVVRNETGVPVCGLYIWRPEDAGGTGMVATSPELNNVLKPGTYLLDDDNDKVLQVDAELHLRFEVPAGDRFTVMARDCEENVVYEETDVCLRNASPLRLND